MDSLTQITLGAAVGEVVLGKKVGNRAMLWGAIGGTIPDMDVMSNFVSDSINSLAFHRTISHSIAFSIITPLILGTLVHRIYAHRENPNGKKLSSSFLLSFLGLFAVIAVGSIPMSMPVDQTIKIALAVSLVVIAFPSIVFLRQLVRRKPCKKRNASPGAWTLLLFWAIFTHPLLDSCTTYGTQLFRPFSDFRVAFNNMSVVDPLYTVPFLLFVIIASLFKRGNNKRRIFNFLGIGISSAYLLFSFYNKVRVDHIFESSLKEQEISYHRMMTAPTIFNNILWNGIAEGDTAFYHGMYSLLDREKSVKQFSILSKNHDLLKDFSGERELEILKWFSKDYYNVIKRKDGRLQYNDLRFGAGSGSFEDESDYVFKFFLKTDGNSLRAYSSREEPEDFNEAMTKLWERMMGI